MKPLLLFLFMCHSCVSIAQELKPWDGVAIEGNVFAGGLLRHSQKITTEMPALTLAAELNLVKHLYGQKSWHQERNYPQVGLGLMILDYGKPEVFGYAIGVYPNIQFPLIKRNNWEWTIRVGFGFCYVTKPFERFPNPNLENTAIGGHLNNISPFNTDWRIRLNKHLDLQAGLSFVHVSNAAFQQPNLGLNMWSAHIGARYFPVGRRGTVIKHEPVPKPNRWLLQARAGIAFTDSWPGNGPRYPSYIGSLYASKRYWGKNKAFAGVDLHYHSSMYVFLKSIEEDTDMHWAATQVAVFAGNEFLYRNVGLMFQVGYYLHRTHDQPEFLYQKLGCNFYVLQQEKGPLKELYFSALLKTHLFVAELFEMGIGFGF